MYPIELLLAGIILLLHLYPILSPPNSLVNWYTTDDAYYYFKVAQNIAEGYGSTFDRIGLTNGYHPLWMLVCIPIFTLARFDLLLPLRVVILVLAVLNAGTGIIIYRLGRKWMSPGVAAMVAFFWTLFPDIHGVTTALGMESGLVAFFTALLLYQASNLFEKQGLGSEKPGQYLNLGSTAALLLLSRLDSAFIIGMFAIWILFRNRRTRILMLGDLLVLIVAVFGAFVLRLKLPLYYYYSSSALLMLVVVVFVQFGVTFLMGLYREKNLSPRILMVRVAMAYGITSLIVAAVMLGLLSIGVIERFPRLTLIWAFLIALALGLAWRLWTGRHLLAAGETSSAGWLSGWKAGLRSGALYLFPVTTTLVAYMGINYSIFGTPSPVSGQVKRWWATIMTVYGKPETTLSGILGLTPNPDLSPWSLFSRIPYFLGDIAIKIKLIGDQNFVALVGLLACILVILIIAITWPNRDRAAKAFSNWNLLPLFAGCVLQLTTYKMSGYVSLHTWYWVPEMMFIVFCGGIILDSFHRTVFTRIHRKVIHQSVWGVLVVALIGLNFWWLNLLTPWKVPEGQEDGYLWGAQGLESNTPVGSLIGSTGGGVLAYFTQDRTIVNMDGLISSYEYFNMLRSGRGAEYFDRIGLDYVYAGEWVLIYSEPYTEIFKGRLKFIDSIVYTDLYKYLPDS